jgi:hypothetical protein
VDQLQARFLALLPRIELHATICFRHIRCPQHKADCIAEAVALAWRRFVRLAERGKDVFEFPVAFVCLVVRAVRCGRRLCGQNAHDVLSPLAQQRHSFRVEVRPQATHTSHEQLCASPLGQEWQDVFEERLHHSASPVPDQAAFRIDFPAWLGTLTARERRLIRAMLRNERTRDLSRQFELSSGRISQLRRQFHDAWLRYHGEQAQAREATGTP